MGDRPERLKDAQGHEWLITGYWCEVCGMPLHSTLRSGGVHPCCDDQRHRGSATKVHRDPYKRSSGSTS